MNFRPTNVGNVPLDSDSFGWVLFLKFEISLDFCCCFRSIADLWRLLQDAPRLAGWVGWDHFNVRYDLEQRHFISSYRLLTNQLTRFRGFFKMLVEIHASDCNFQCNLPAEMVNDDKRQRGGGW